MLDASAAPLPPAAGGPVFSVPVFSVPVFSVVVPVFDEEAGLLAFHARLVPVMDRLGEWEAVYVNDGSQDGSNCSRPRNDNCVGAG